MSLPEPMSFERTKWTLSTEGISLVANKGQTRKAAAEGNDKQSTKASSMESSSSSSSTSKPFECSCGKAFVHDGAALAKCEKKT